MNTSTRTRWYWIGHNNDASVAEQMGAEYAAKYGVNFRIKRFKDRYAPAPTFIVEVDENPAKGVKR